MDKLEQARSEQSRLRRVKEQMYSQQIRGLICSAHNELTEVVAESLGNSYQSAVESYDITTTSKEGIRTSENASYLETQPGVDQLIKVYETHKEGHKTTGSTTSDYGNNQSSYTMKQSCLSHILKGESAIYLFLIIVLDILYIMIETNDPLIEGWVLSENLDATSKITIFEVAIEFLTEMQCLILSHHQIGKKLMYGPLVGAFRADLYQNKKELFPIGFGIYCKSMRMILQKDERKKKFQGGRKGEPIQTQDIIDDIFQYLFAIGATKDVYYEREKSDKPILDASEVIDIKNAITKQKTCIAGNIEQFSDRKEFRPVDWIIEQTQSLKVKNLLIPKLVRIPGEQYHNKEINCLIETITSAMRTMRKEFDSKPYCFKKNGYSNNTYISRTQETYYQSISDDMSPTVPIMEKIKVDHHTSSRTDCTKGITDTIRREQRGMELQDTTTNDYESHMKPNRHKKPVEVHVVKADKTMEDSTTGSSCGETHMITSRETYESSNTPIKMKRKELESPNSTITVRTNPQKESIQGRFKDSNHKGSTKGTSKVPMQGTGIPCSPPSEKMQHHDKTMEQSTHSRNVVISHGAIHRSRNIEQDRHKIPLNPTKLAMTQVEQGEISDQDSDSKNKEVRAQGPEESMDRTHPKEENIHTQTFSSATSHRYVKTESPKTHIDPAEHEISPILQPTSGKTRLEESVDAPESPCYKSDTTIKGIIFDMQPGCRSVWYHQRYQKEINWMNRKYKSGENIINKLWIRENLTSCRNANIMQLGIRYHTTKSLDWINIPLIRFFRKLYVMIGDHNADIVANWPPAWQSVLAKAGDNPYELEGVMIEIHNFIERIKLNYIEIDEITGYDVGQIIIGIIFALALTTSMEVETEQELSAMILRCFLLGMQGEQKYSQIEDTADLETPQVISINNTLVQTRRTNNSDKEISNLIEPVLSFAIECERLYMDNDNINLSSAIQKVAKLFKTTDVDSYELDDRIDTLDTFYLSQQWISDRDKRQFQAFTRANGALLSSFNNINCDPYHRGDHLKSIVGSLIMHAGQLEAHDNPIHTTPDLNKCLVIATRNYVIASILHSLGDVQYI